MNAISTVTWLLPYLIFPTFYVGIAVLMYYIRRQNVISQTNYQNGVPKQQQNWITANKTALNYLLYTSIGFLLGLIVFLLALGKVEAERWHGGSMKLYIMYSCFLMILLSNVARKYKLKQIAAHNEKSDN